VTRPRGRPRLCGDARSFKTSVIIPLWVKDELERTGPRSTVAREVLERWAEGQGASGPPARETAIVSAITAVDSAARALETAQKALLAARKSLSKYVPKEGS
jgi:hypothetical protein